MTYLLYCVASLISPTAIVPINLIIDEETLLWRGGIGGDVCCCLLDEKIFLNLKLRRFDGLSSSLWELLINSDGGLCILFRRFDDGISSSLSELRINDDGGLCILFRRTIEGLKENKHTPLKVEAWATQKKIKYIYKPQCPQKMMNQRSLFSSIDFFN